MSHKRRPPNKRKAPTKSVPAPKRNTSPLALISIAATLIGGLAAVLAFLPRPVVSVGDPVDADNPFSCSFTVTNANFIPLKHVTVGFAPGDMEFEGGFKWKSSEPLSADSGTITKPEWKDHYLGIDERFTISPSEVFNPDAIKTKPLRKADIAILVQYQPKFVPVWRSKMFRFQMYRQTNGKFYWYSIPLK